MRPRKSEIFDLKDGLTESDVRECMEWNRRIVFRFPDNRRGLLMSGVPVAVQPRSGIATFVVDGHGIYMVDRKAMVCIAPYFTAPSGILEHEEWYLRGIPCSNKWKIK